MSCYLVKKEVPGNKHTKGGLRHVTKATQISHVHIKPTQLLRVMRDIFLRIETYHRQRGMRSVFKSTNVFYFPHFSG